MQRYHIEGPPLAAERLLGLDRRYILPTIVVFLLCIVLTGVLPAIDQSIAADEIPPGTVVNVGQVGNVTFVPASGWIFESAPFPNSPSIAVFDGGVTFQVHVGAFDGSSAELLDRIVSQRGQFEVTGDRVSVPLRSGLVGVATRFTGAQTEGALFAFATQSGTQPVGIEVEVKAPRGITDAPVQEVAGMLNSITVGSTGGR